MKTKILFSLALCIFLVASVSAIDVDSEWSDGSTSITISDGQSVSFTAYAFSIDAPMTIDVKLYDSDDNLVEPGGTFEDDLSVEGRTFSETYSIDKTIYKTPGVFTLKVNGIDTFPGSDLSTLTLTVVNDAPVITTSAILTVAENTAYSYNVDATDINGNTLTYSLATAPTWLSIDSSTGLISGTAPIVASDAGFGVTVSVSDGITSTTQIYTLTVLDTSSGNIPVITPLGTTPITIQAGSAYVDAGATALDVEDGILTASIVTTGLPINTSSLGTYIITYDVSDSNANSAVTVTRTVIVVDTTAPVITLVGSSTVTITQGGTYVEQGATVTDNYDASWFLLPSSGSVNTSVIGTYILTYSAADSNGNPAVSVNRTVNIVAGSSPSSSSGGSGNVVYASTDVSTPSSDESEITSPPVSLGGQKSSSTSVWMALFILVSVLILGIIAVIASLLMRR